MTDDPYFTEVDLQFFAQYGLTMLRVQQFEQSLKQLAQLSAPETPEDATFDQAWKQVRKILTSATGPLTHQLAEHGKVPSQLLEELREVTKGRNGLAHEYLLWYVLRKNLGEVTPEEEIATLQEAEQHFHTLDTQLTELSDGLLRDRGIDPNEEHLTEEEGREILREMLAEGESDEAH